jgi:hypothetical protein
MTHRTAPSVRQLLADLHAYRVQTMARADLQVNIDQRRLLETPGWSCWRPRWRRRWAGSPRPVDTRTGSFLNYILSIDFIDFRPG